MTIYKMRNVKIDNFTKTKSKSTTKHRMFREINLCQSKEFYTNAVGDVGDIQKFCEYAGCGLANMDFVKVVWKVFGQESNPNFVTYSLFPLNTIGLKQKQL